MCTFWGGEASTALADEVIAASETVQMPPFPAPLAKHVHAYWEAMSRGTGRDYTSALHRGSSSRDGSNDRGSALRNRVYGYRMCSEATSNTFWSGAPYDYLAREYVASLTNLGIRKLGLHSERNLTALDTVAVSAMEGTGWMSVLMMREMYKRGVSIPFVNLRGAADYTHAPVRPRPHPSPHVLTLANAPLATSRLRPSASDPLSLSPSCQITFLAMQATRANLSRTSAWANEDVWLSNPHFMPKISDESAFMAAGYQHSIRTSSEVLLHLFRTRRQATVARS